MSRRKRRWYTAAEKSEMWDRWQRGESLNAIARAFETSHSAITNNFARFGGIRPPGRQRSRLALTLSEREEISRGIVGGFSLRTIARQLGRAPSTISREISRNGGLKRYRAYQADKAAWDRAYRPKPCKLAGSLRLGRIVASKLQCHWSPEQIAGWLKKAHAGNERLQVSHETIYRSLFIQARGVLKRELLQYLRTRRVMRYPQKTSLKGQGKGHITDAVSIRERPASVEDRAVPGHWEGDLICGSNNSFMATLVERHTRYVMLAKVPGKETETVINALIKQARKLPNELYKSLTWDRGSEMADQLYDLGFHGMQPRSLKQKHLEASGETIEWRDGPPYADEDKWNSAKSEYCESVGIDFMIDDSPIYLKTFHDIDTTYLHVINQGREICEVRQ